MEQTEKDEDDQLENIQIPEQTKKLIREAKNKHEEELKQKERKEQEKQTQEQAKNTANVSKFVTVKTQSASLTSTTMGGVSQMQVDARAIVKHTDKKGYVRLSTTLGDLNIELHCDLVPKTCENFIGLCEKGYYDNTIFHRLIPNFMIQGGDPTGTGKGGQSLWGDRFQDEIRIKLQHQGRGILSMANSGPDTNKSQFFITFASCPHLNGKHSIFGRVVGGQDTLNKMEAVPTDEKTEKPIHEIKILKTTVFVNPFDEKKEKELAEAKAKQDAEDKQRGKWFSNPGNVNMTSFKSGIGKYIPPNTNPTPNTTTPAKTNTTNTTNTTTATTTTNTASKQTNTSTTNTNTAKSNVSLGHVGRKRPLEE